MLGQLLAVTDPAGAAARSRGTHVAEVVASTDALECDHERDLGRSGQLSSWTDALRARHVHGQDVVGRPVGLRAADGSTSRRPGMPSAPDLPERMPSVRHHDDPRRQGLVTWTDANGGVWQTSYDPVGRALTSTDPAGVVTSYAWDAAGQLVGSYSDGTHRVAWAYDADGRR
ncbi:MAG: hypothetical protein U0667_12030 [Chloroflexota bacterium]